MSHLWVPEIKKSVLLYYIVELSASEHDKDEAPPAPVQQKYGAICAQSRTGDQPAGTNRI